MLAHVGGQLVCVNCAYELNAIAHDTQRARKRAVRRGKERKRSKGRR